MIKDFINNNCGLKEEEELYNLEKEVFKNINQLEDLKILLKHHFIKDDNNEIFIEKIGELLEDVSNVEYQIALVGAIKAGKSTLINAILGKDLASTSVTPETASLTKFRKADKNYLKISFYSSEEWEILMESVLESKSDIFIDRYEELEAEKIKSEWIDGKDVVKEFYSIDEMKIELKNWTSCEIATHYFVKSVEVGICDLDLPIGVVLVDTPGLDDPVKYRSDITRDYINQAHGVLVCVNSKALTATELLTINAVFSNARYRKEKIFIIGTQVDLLNNPTSDWKQQKNEWIKNLSDFSHYNDKVLAENNILGVAAYIDILIDNYKKNNDITLKKEIYQIAIRFSIVDPFDIAAIDESEVFKRLKESSMFLDLYNKLSIEVIGKHKVDIYKNFNFNFLDLKEEILTKVENVKSKNQELLEMIDGNISEILERKKDVEFKLRELKEKEEQMKILMKGFNTMVIDGKKKIFQELDKRAKEIY